MAKFIYSNEVLQELKKYADPFVDTDPNRVALRILVAYERAAIGSQLEEAKNGGKSLRDNADDTLPPRAPIGSLLPESEYVAPILTVVAESGGRASTHTVINRVGEILRERFTELDRQPLSNGDIRWRKRVQFTRLRMVERDSWQPTPPEGSGPLHPRDARGWRSRMPGCETAPISPPLAG